MVRNGKSQDEKGQEERPGIVPRWWGHVQWVARRTGLPQGGGCRKALPRPFLTPGP
jgi:hypothetical protein